MPVDATMPLRHAVFGGGGRQAPDPGHREGEDVDRTGGLRFCFSSIFREGGRRLRGGGKKLLAREFGRSQQRRSRSCSDVVKLNFVPSACSPWKRHFSSKNSVRRDLLMTSERRNARSYSIRNSSSLCIFSSLLCLGNATSPPFVLHRNYAHPLHPPREHALSTPSSTLRWASPSITTQFPK